MANKVFYYDDEVLAEMKKSELERERFDPSDVHVETKNTQMMALINRMKDDAIELSPDFQRSPDVWKDDRQSRLIESMLLRIPLPAFYMDATDDDKWLVVDGLQRLNAINRFIREQSLKLTGLKIMKEYEGKKFSELDIKLQRRIEETDIVIHQIKRGTPDAVRYEIFNRINTGGTPLSPQEIRHALNPGPFLEYLARLASRKEFIDATCEGVSPDRMDDQECVLRFLAFSFMPPEDYRDRDFNFFLNKAMSAGNRLSDQKMKEYEERFIRAMETSRKIFRDKAFRKFYAGDTRRSPVNKPLFETVSVNIGNLNTEQQNILIRIRADVVKGMRKLIANDKKFESSISGGTGSVQKVQYRFAAVKNMLMEILNAE